MSQKEKRVYLEAIRRRYRKSGRGKKAKILDEFCAVCGYNPKYAIRILKHQKKKKRQKCGRKPRYDAQKILIVLKAIWFATDQICSKRLKAVLPQWVPHYETEHGSLNQGAY